MQRDLLSKLVEWKTSAYRMPLILTGVRQVGKTWLLKEFGKKYYDNVAYFNFEEHAEFRQIFESTLDVERILRTLTLASGQKVLPGKTLIIFDEIQTCPQALNSLKYFCENAPQYHITAAGSLLGITLAKPSSFPVGKVNFMQLDPMSFSEFVRAGGDEGLVEYMRDQNCLKPLLEAFYNPLTQRLKEYLVVGGMPRIVSYWCGERDLIGVEQGLSDILKAYAKDFQKHLNPYEAAKISYIWQSLPSQLSRENKKFLYQTVKQGARAREYEGALQWLIDARLLHKISRIKAPGLPLAAYDDLSAFKLYPVDVGLLRRMANLEPSTVILGDRLFTEFKGALSESFVLQSLVPHYGCTPRYWSQNNPPHEVDFVIQHKNEVIPIEVKASTNTESRSLKRYAELFKDSTPLRVRFSLRNLSMDGEVLNIPLFMADETTRLIDMALDRLAF